MFDDSSREYKNQFVPLDPIDVDIYKEFVGEKAIEELKWLAEPLEGKVWANVNSTFVGGGVAEMLKSVVPFAKGLGINCHWFVIEGTDDFFTVTKKFHNLLQGQDVPISMDDIFQAYLNTVEDNFKQKKVVAHMTVIHDPQPAAAIMNKNLYGHTLWRCHIDTSEANLNIWRFLLPYINQYDGAIFTDPSFINPGTDIPAYQISPAIDPLKEKNKQYTLDEAQDILKPLFKKYQIDPSRPIALAVSRYDIHKNQKTIVQAFKELKSDKDIQKLNPQLIFVGNSASDDPEGQEMYDLILSEIGDDKDIYPLLNIENNDQNIGALMKLARCFIHVSTKEGFGLVVTEALWQGTPVIGSKVGGISQQVIDNQTGFLVKPFDIKSISKHIKTLLKDEDLSDKLGKNAIEHVRANFLIPSLVKKYLLLMRYYLEIDNSYPKFRINDITYKEIKSALFGRSVWPFSLKDLNNKIKEICEDV